MRIVDADTLRGMLEHDDVLLIDVMPHERFAVEHIKGAVNLPVDDPDFADEVESLAEGEDSPIVVYSIDRDRGEHHAAMRRLEQRGFRNVLGFDGGIAAWKQHGLPIEESARTG